MIDATQLRIGNYLMAAEEEYKGKIFKIDAGDIKHIREGMEKYKYESVQISSDILLACGFENDGIFYFMQPELENIHYRVQEVPGGWRISKGFFSNWDDEITLVNELHMLQNVIYFISGGLELTYSPNTK